MSKKQKLELTWIGKENRPKLEPRILIEDPEKSYHAKHKVSENDIFDNMLIHGDNLLALKALEQDYTGKVKCVYIDPPFNTGEAFEHYEDGIEHSLWLSLMRDRLLIIQRLLSIDGTLFVHIDDNELGYLIILLDEIFGRINKRFIATFKQGSATGHKSINPGCVNTTNYVLVYSKKHSEWRPNRMFTQRSRDTRYGKFIANIDEHYSKWQFITLIEAFAQSQKIELKQARKLIKERPDLIDDFVLNNASQVVRDARPAYQSVSEEARQLIDISKANPDQVVLLERENYSDMYFKRGERILFYADKLKTVDGKLVAGEPLTTLWDNLLSNNLHAEGNVKFPKGKKPEALIKRCIELSTELGDLVLDSFLGSGTTAAVAHKMGRRWIGIELGEHCYTHCIPRLQKVIDGEDQGGISKTANWQGGGGFRFYELGPSLIKEDEWNNPIINPEFNPDMLAEAMCKLEGFTYAPSDENYWIHGNSSETDYIYVTTQFVSKAMLDKLSDEVGQDKSLLICCSAFKADPKQFPNLTIKKIPKAVLKKCEWGHDDYSLEIKNLPDALETEEILTPEPEEKNAKNRKFGKGKTGLKQLSLFDSGGDE